MENLNTNDEYEYAIFLHKNKFLPGPTVCDLCGGKQFSIYRDKYAKTSMTSFRCLNNIIRLTLMILNIIYYLK